ncbi:hypothetical protein IYN88_21550 [Comamonas testosteroni]|nr:hypothetical protein IYN88_21550 [Comamonas testosteroni]
MPATLRGFAWGTVWGNAGNQSTPYLLGMAGNQVFIKTDVPSSVSHASRPPLYTAIQDVQQLQAIQNDLAGRYALVNHIDASATAGWNLNAGIYNGFVPIGSNSDNTDATRFTGSFDGLGHSIRDLTVNVTQPQYLDSSGYSFSNAGLFGATGSAARIAHVGLDNASIKASGGVWNSAGALAGWNSGAILQSYATGNATAEGGSGNSAGALVGKNHGGNISQSYATGSGSISISQSYATGSATAEGGSGNSAGALVGVNINGNISQSYATGSATAKDGNANFAGALAGENYGSISQSYWSADRNPGQPGVGNNSGLDAESQGLTDAEFQKASSFAAWGSDIDDQGGTGAAWRIYEGHSTPLLRTFLKQVTVDLGALASKTYDGTTGSGVIGGSDYSIAPSVVLGGAGSDLSYQSNNKNAGNYSAKNGGLLVSGLYSNQQGYDISYQGSFEITQASLTVTADAASKVYGDADDLKYTSSGLIHGDSLGGSLGRAAGENVGSYAIHQGSLANSNYRITFTGNQLQITPKALTVTADAASKVYGDADDLKYTSSGLINGDRLGGSLGRAAGENVGSYAIHQGSLANSNYSISFNGNQLQITPKALTVTADAASKVYGDADDLRYTSSGLIHGDSLSGSLGRAAGENVGSYAINQGSLANSNYSITFKGNQLHITPKALTVTADAASKVYGDGDADDLKYTSSGLIHGDSLSGSLGRAAGENVGSYAIHQGSLANSNYRITFTGNQLQITPKALTVTADAASKVYGDADDLRYTSSGLINGDRLGGSLGRAAGENVGSYAIHQGSLANSNYRITFTGNQLQITPKALTVTADAASKVYGDADDLKYTSSGLINGDRLGGSLGRAAGENVGSYAIHQGSLANSNYSITFKGNQLQITPKALTVTADAASKVYGDADDLRYTSSGLINGDRLGGSLGRAAGENVGSYAIHQGSLANSNYSITFKGNQLQITPKALTVTADAASKVYGDADDLRYTSSGLINGDRLGGSLGRASGENVGSYAINQGSLAHSNYSITFTGDQLQITPKALTITAGNAQKTTGQSLVFQGHEFTTQGLVGAEQIQSVQLDSAGAAASAAAGSYAIVASHLRAGAGFDARNYDIRYVDGQLQVQAQAQRTALGVGDLWRLYSPQLMQQPGPQVPPAQKKPLLTIEPEHIRMAAI